MVHQPAGIADLEVTSLDGGFTGDPEAFQQELGVVFHGFQHLRVGVAPHHMVQLVTAVLGEPNVHGVGRTKQVVQVAHHFLVGPAEEHADPVGLAWLKRMEF